MAPGALLAVGLAPAMMQEHVSRARGVRAGVGSDNSVEAEDRLDRIALEPLVEKVAGRAGKNLDQVALALKPERAEAVCDFRRIEQRAETGEQPLSRNEIRRRFERERAQHVSHAFKARFVGLEPVGVARRELGHLGPCPPRSGFQISAVRQRQEVRERPLHNAEAISLELEIVNNLRVQ